MRLTLNGRFVDEQPSTLEALLARKGIDAPSGIAVALNDAVVPRCTWSKTKLQDGDRIEVLTASQGG